MSHIFKFSCFPFVFFLYYLDFRMSGEMYVPAIAGNQTVCGDVTLQLAQSRAISRIVEKPNV
jgi:hypothetical protein